MFLPSSGPFRVSPSFGSLLGPFWASFRLFYRVLYVASGYHETFSIYPCTFCVLGKIHYHSPSRRGVPLRSLSVREEKKKRKRKKTISEKRLRIPLLYRGQKVLFSLSFYPDALFVALWGRFIYPLRHRRRRLPARL